jgi:hypothetical protein
MGFWDSMQRGAESAIGTHKEIIQVAGEDVEAAVNPAELDQPLTDGGHRVAVEFDFLVPTAAGDGMAEGAAVTARGMSGKIVRKMHEGSHWRMSVGPKHRLGGGSIPGV